MIRKRQVKLTLLLIIVFVLSYSISCFAASNPYPSTQDVDRDGNYEVPCTRFAWQRVYDVQGIALPAWGNAVNWFQGAKNSGYATGSEPKPGAIAVWSGDTYGHVAYVVSGSGSTFTVDEGGRTDKDNTSSHGVVYGYTLTNSVGGSRPYDTGKTLLGFIYPGESANHDPEGYLDEAEGGCGTIHVRGWAIDKDTPNQAVSVHIYADGPAGVGKCIYTGIVANQSSPDIGGNHRFDVTFETDLTGEHTIYAHAINTQPGNNPVLNFTGGQPFKVTITKDNTPPVISNVQVSDVSWEGYTVTCDVSDNKALDRVVFPTWTLNNGQDDLPSVWGKGTVSNGKATYRVKTSEHNDETGCKYCTKIYAYDKEGNEASSEVSVDVPAFEENITEQWQESDKIPSNIDTSKYEIQYRHTYTKTAESSPGEGWERSGNGTTTYVLDGGVYDSDFELSVSNTRVYVGSYYYHYCGASTGANVEHYNDGVHTDYHIAGDVNQFTVTGGPWTDDNDSRYLVYKISWTSGQWAGGAATCSAGRSAIWYRRYQYQNKKAVTNYKWVKVSDWENVKDNSASSVRYRCRLKDSAQPVIKDLKVSEITKDGYKLICHASDDNSIAKIVFTSWAETESEQNAKVQEIVPQSSDGIYEAAATINIADHNNNRDCWYYTKIQVSDAAGNVVDYTGNLGKVFVPFLIRSNTKLSLPEGTKTIEESAFEGDINLREVVLPEGLETIGSRAFADCSRISVVYVPDSVQEIDDSAFSGSTNVVLICSAESKAADFARRNEIPYVTGE